MKQFFLIAILSIFIGGTQVNAQNANPITNTGNQWVNPNTGEPFKIIFQLSTGDTLAHKAMMKQIGNMTSVAPQTQIEVVCHGPGLDMLHQKKSSVMKKIMEFQGEKVQFSACQFSMKERKVSPEEIIPGAGYVEAGILHIVLRQAQGCFYIKAGF